MNTEETFKEKRHHRLCRLFHPIETLENCSFIDKVTGEADFENKF